MAAPTRLMLRALVLGGAGLVTFYVAAQLSRTAMAPAEEDIVLPATPASAPVSARPRAAASAAVPAAASALSAASALPAASALASASAPVAAASRAVPSSEGQAFARLNWLPPPPPPPPPPPAPKPAAVVPTAPPLPFSFVGMVENGMGKPQAFLSKGDALLIVSAGDLLDNNTYRVDSLDANRVVLTYLPLTMKQTIDISGAAK